MGVGPGLRKSLLFRSRKWGVTLLAFAVAVAPLPGTMPVAHATQTGSQGSASSTNGMASMMSTVMGGLSMAMGGLFIWNGGKELKECMSSDPTPGAAGGEAQAGDATVRAGAAERGDALRQMGRSLDAEAAFRPGTPADGMEPLPVRGPPGGSGPNLKLQEINKLRFPESVRNDSKPWQNLRLPFSQFLMLANPTEAQAMSKCVSGGLALLTGGVMLLSGIMGMMAANQARNNASNAASNMGNLGSIPPPGATSPTPSSTNNPNGSGSSTNIASGASREPIKIDPSLLRTGKADAVMSQFENRFGIPRDQFMNAVANGKDPREILTNAPKNAISSEDMNKAMSGAQGLSDSQKANAMANSDLAALQAEMQAKMDASGASEYAQGGGSSKGSSLRKPASDGLDSAPDLFGAAAVAPPIAGVSPEVQAALAARDQEQRMQGIHNDSIFAQVHRRYQERSRMIFGVKAPGTTGALGGIGNADGM